MSTVVSLICLGPLFQKMTQHFLLHGSLRPINPEKNLKPCELILILCHYTGAGAQYCHVVFGPNLEEATARDLRNTEGK